MLAPGVARLSLDVVSRGFAAVYIVVGTAMVVPAVSVVVEVVVVAVIGDLILVLARLKAR